ncbi:hypothetical protein L210DRAFT_2634781 [Boletus edulis BED1]|uniref:Zn(2)-C6 fungal-type domain-containing protein n=1 Tax=Boletus edulis BED1 TaxID=1328754 RepID=A0AAD4GL45_BOLED|nr:hypothetical protein L210DRAFT_2634781 [Boletus edulis BED1]
MDSQPPLDPTPIPVSDITTTPWPRRVIKACASCRRDKIRCDGSKPCGACAKKGYTFDQCIDGCESCRKARVRCEGGKPCQRCRELDQECVEEQVTTGIRSDVAPPVFVLRNRQKSERAKLACQNCRRDNKKVRWSSLWVAGGVIIFDSVTINDLVRGVLRGGKTAFMLGEDQSLSSCVAKDVDTRIVNARTLGPASSASNKGGKCVNVQRKGRGHGTRACATCRRDKVRCDGARPCTTCVRKGYQCVDRVCAACVQQGLEGECPHRPLQEADTSDGDGAGHRDGQPMPTETPTGVQHTFIPNNPPLPMPPHPPQSGLAPQMFPSHVYGLSPYMLAAQHPMHGPGEGSSTGYSRTPYYPVIDPQIDLPQPNISSERYDPSSAQAGTSSRLS